MKNLEKYDVAIIGAGICGITAGSYLTKNDLSVKILDKGKAIGGRLATRRIKFNDQLYQVDYGCKYLEANSFEFSQQVVELINNDIVKKWNTAHQNSLLDELDRNLKFIGRQSMRQIAIELSQGLDIESSTKVDKLKFNNGEWIFEDNEGHALKAEAVILTMPVPQSLDLIKKSKLTIDEKIYENLRKVEYERSIAGIFILEGESNLKNEGGLKLDDGAISFITDNSLKGVNNTLTAVTVEMSNAFSLENWNRSDNEITHLIIEKSHDYFKSNVLKSQIHKWRYSKPLISYPKKFEFTDSPGKLYFAGDAFLGNNVESAYLSGLYAATNLHHNYSNEPNKIEF